MDDLFGTALSVEREGYAATERRSARAVWPVAALLQAAGDALADRFAACTVRGELSGFARAGSGHCYFGLKDADGGDAVLRCAMFRRAAMQTGFAPADGQLVEVRGRLAIYPTRGELQFVVASMQRAGAGALLEQFLRLKARLEAEGLFDAARKRRPATHPRCIGVVTSPAAAALRDVAISLMRRAPHVAGVIYPCAVQGAEAPAAIVAAIAAAASRGEADTLIVCRGGGSLEDLWAFNDERVVRAIAASPIPVICGVGHETDVTLADFAADLRAPTPTAAAELATAATRDCLDRLAACAALLGRRVHQRLETQAQRLDALALRLARPIERVHREARRVDAAAQRLAAARERDLERRRLQLERFDSRLHRAAERALAARRQGYEGLAGRLAAVDPRQVLRRGYAWLSRPGDGAVTSVAAVAAGDALDAVLHDGRLAVKVTATMPSS